MFVFEFDMIPFISIQLCGRWRQNIHPFCEARL